MAKRKIAIDAATVSRAIQMVADSKYRPEGEGDFSDVAQAKVFKLFCGDKVRYSKETGFLVYNGSKWECDDLEARRLAQELTEKQIAEACKQEEGLLKCYPNSDVEEELSDQYRRTLKTVQEYKKKITCARRRSGAIDATLKEAAPLLAINTEELDKDGFLLNTPGGVVDLRTGEISPHRAEYYCTKITTVSPGTENAEVFDQFLDDVTCGNFEMKDFLQAVLGMAAIGKVFLENLLMVYGKGGNGKSTLFNLVSRVLGDYAGTIPADTLTANRMVNRDPEIAQLRGKRLIIAAELAEGKRLDTSNLKKLCSTDRIAAREIYKAPISFTPSHTIILYTNQIPKVGATDQGTWDRIVIVPFTASFRGEKKEIKNYADVLFRQCGGAVLQWIVDGARKYIENDCKIELPQAVKEACREYREDNDILKAFLEECCEIGPGYITPSREVYTLYRDYCQSKGEFIRSDKDFKRELVNRGFEYAKKNNGRYYKGLRLHNGYPGVNDHTPFDGISVAR